MSTSCECCICKKHENVYKINKENNGENQTVNICEKCLEWLWNDVKDTGYMIGSVFGSMWNGGHEFSQMFSYEGGIVFKTKEEAEFAIESLANKYGPDYKLKLKIFKKSIKESWDILMESHSEPL